MTALGPLLPKLTASLIIRCGGRTISNLAPGQLLIYGLGSFYMDGCVYVHRPGNVQQPVDTAMKVPARLTLHNSVVEMAALQFMTVRR